MYDTAAFKMGILKKTSSCNQACACVIPNENINIIWLYYELYLMKEYFLSQRRGVRQKNLNLGMIKKFEIPVSKYEDQLIFADFVTQTDKSKLLSGCRLFHSWAPENRDKPKHVGVPQRKTKVLRGGRRQQ